MQLEPVHVEPKLGCNRPRIADRNDVLDRGRAQRGEPAARRVDAYLNRPVSGCEVAQLRANGRQSFQGRHFDSRWRKRHGSSRALQLEMCEERYRGACGLSIAPLRSTAAAVRHCMYDGLLETVEKLHTRLPDPVTNLSSSFRGCPRGQHPESMGLCPCFWIPGSATLPRND